MYEKNPFIESSLEFVYPSEITEYPIPKTGPVTAIKAESEKPNSYTQLYSPLSALRNSHKLFDMYASDIVVEICGRLKKDALFVILDMDKFKRSGYVNALHTLEQLSVLAKGELTGKYYINPIMMYRGNRKRWLLSLIPKISTVVHR